LVSDSVPDVLGKRLTVCRNSEKLELEEELESLTLEYSFVPPGRLSGARGSA
jgi:hypothetical protein